MMIRTVSGEILCFSLSSGHLVSVHAWYAKLFHHHHHHHHHRQHFNCISDVLSALTTGSFRKDLLSRCLSLKPLCSYTEPTEDSGLSLQHSYRHDPSSTIPRYALHHPTRPSTLLRHCFHGLVLDPQSRCIDHPQLPCRMATYRPPTRPRQRIQSPAIKQHEPSPSVPVPTRRHELMRYLDET
ncbi:Protein of unknown function [Pyronema omphalodes CBS 100304]|uniref:Uncharacterized protein n=1 Tax=Pyronema omphalodes (strain CBS 100304) TaxID=1076935 RepID=U4L746_PYROM|nr:Protein of unknown function [Pyronema omphalodes CBS 100304]